MKRILKRSLSTALSLVMLLSLLTIGFNSISVATTFDDINQSSVFIKQQTNTTCTLASAVMMMRRAAMASGNSNWASITEISTKPTAWVSGQGLRRSFSYAGITVNYASLPGGNSNIQRCIDLLTIHPEGIVIYNKDSVNNIYHAILLTDYTDGVFYCCDPQAGTPNGRTNISNAKKVTITNADVYWYVSSPSVSLTPPHICSYDTFSYYEDTHPHYAVYKCTCGATQKHSEKSPYDECTLCPPPSATDLSVTPGTSSTETTITWNSRNVLVSSCNNCYFILHIYDSNNNLIKTAEETCSMTNLNPSVSFILPTGNYTAHLFTFKNDEYSNFSSISISFSVSQETNVLKAIPGTSTTPTTLSWLIIPGATICQPVIEDFYTGEIVESEMFKSNENNSWSVILPKGKYCAYLMTDNSNREDLKYGNDIVFTVLEGSFTLDYNSNGGYDSPASQTGSTSYIIPSTTPAKQGYVFLGWSKNSTSSFVSYVAGDCITLTSDTMLYAVWEYEIYILCEYCGKTFNTETRYEEHIEKEHVYSFSEKCPTCGDDFNNISTYNIHVNICLPDSYSGTLSYMCSYCGDAFNNQSTFVSHTANCPQKTTALGCLKHCYYCENQFYDEHEFNNHLQSCRPVEKCSFCEKEFLRFEVENHQASCNNKNYYYDIIKTPSTSTISYGDAIILRVDAAKIPADGYVEWTVSNNHFDLEVSADGMTCKITPSSSGDTTFTATVYDANGNAVSKDEQTMTSKAGFFDKIIAFFKKLFGLTKTYENIYKSIF